MNTNFDKCLKNGLIREFSRGPALTEKELENAKLDLETAKVTLEQKNYKWATIQTYYSMFHSARALLYTKSYRERSHQCLLEAIRNFYVEEKKIGFWLVEALQEARILRENADYYGEFTKEKAEELVEKAGEFLNRARKILSLK
jgi:uncharacterized protein (UPF0332 family)